jgi:hypothetical protein
MNFSALHKLWSIALASIFTSYSFFNLYIFYGVQVDDYDSYYMSWSGTSFNFIQPGFDFIILALSLFFTYDFSRFLIGAISIIFFAVVLLRKSRNSFILFLILIWYSTSLFVIHLRMGLALGLLYFFFHSSESRAKRVLLFSLIHYSVLIPWYINFLRVGKFTSNVLFFLALLFLFTHISNTDFGVVYGLNTFDSDYALLFLIFVLLLIAIRVRALYLLLYIMAFFICKFYAEGELSARASSILVLLLPLLFSKISKFSKSTNCRMRKVHI